MTYNTYKKYKLKDGTVVTDSIKVPKTADHADIYIPFSEGNKDYIEYKAWLAEGNTPEDADQTVYKLTTHT